jgi:hypothetical protein
MAPKLIPHRAKARLIYLLVIATKTLAGSCLESEDDGTVAQQYSLAVSELTDPPSTNP